jgi:hypothetical protein
VALAICTGEALALSNMLTVPAGTPPPPVTVTVNDVKVVVDPDVGQACVLDCVDSKVEVVVRPKAPTAGNSASAMTHPATQ